MNQKLHDEVYEIIQNNKKPRAYLKITELIDSRVCEKCKHCIQRKTNISNNDAISICKNILNYRQVDKAFGCNKWEA